MKIAIIGGGWVGCHLAYKLKKEHDVKIYEKNNELFKETSFKNQNRLHYGFHYARNNRTRELCKNTFYKFIKDYGFLTKEIKTNLYCVPKKNSIVDYDTYIKIFHDFDYEKSELKFSNIDGCIKTKERHINFIDVSNFFNVELKNNVITQNVDASILKQLKNEYDFVINATNNFIKDETINDSFYELTITFLYEKINETNFDAITLVDGDFFSIYPYEKNIFTVTDVEYTPLKKFKTVSDIENYKKRIDIAFVNERRKLIEEKIKNYYSEFLENFKYFNYFLSVKSKMVNKSDDRYPIITRNENTVNCFTGKIQGIYVIEDMINKILYSN